MGLLILGHFMIFVLAIGHDEIVAECVASGPDRARHAEAAELGRAARAVPGWTVLTVAIVRMVDAARSGRRGVMPGAPLTCRLHRRMR